MKTVQILQFERHDLKKKCGHDYQIENLAETNFVEIFGRAKQILSVQCVRTPSHSKTMQVDTIYQLIKLIIYIALTLLDSDWLLTPGNKLEEIRLISWGRF